MSTEKITESIAFLERYPTWRTGVDVRTLTEANLCPADITKHLAALIEFAKAPHPDTARLDWYEENAGGLRARNHAVADTGDVDGHWEVIELHMAKPHERVIGAGTTVRAAIDAAMSAQQDELDRRLDEDPRDPEDREEQR